MLLFISYIYHGLKFGLIFAAVTGTILFIFYVPAIILIIILQLAEVLSRISNIFVDS